MDQIDAFAQMTLRAYASWGIVLLVLSLIERVFAKESTTWSGRAAGLLFWMIWIPATLLTSMVLWRLWAVLGIKPLLSIDTVKALGWAGPFAAGTAMLIGLLIGDFFAYWFHRIQHRFLWRYHAVHHSISDMSAVNSYHHISETFFNTLIIAIPISLITVNYGPTLWIVGVLVWFQGVFLHSPTTINFGFFRNIVADNRYHRIHHSLEPRHFDKNFAIMFSFWDRLFGTAHAPGRDEWPAVGLTQIAQPQSVREWLDLPIRYNEPAVEHDDRMASPERGVVVH